MRMREVREFIISVVVILVLTLVITGTLELLKKISQEPTRRLPAGERAKLEAAGMGVSRSQQAVLDTMDINGKITPPPLFILPPSKLQCECK